jgi:hypothetical protein
MADNQYPKCRAETEQEEAILAMGIIWVLKQERPIVVEDGLCLFKRDSVLPSVLGVLLGVPFEADIGHGPESVTTT